MNYSNEMMNDITMLPFNKATHCFLPLKSKIMNFSWVKYTYISILFANQVTRTYETMHLTCNMTVQYNRIDSHAKILLESMLSFTVISVTFSLLTRSDVAVITTNSSVSCKSDDFTLLSDSVCMDIVFTYNTTKTDVHKPHHLGFRIYAWLD